jgi:hypothetical protein
MRTSRRRAAAASRESEDKETTVHDIGLTALAWRMLLPEQPVVFATKDHEAVVLALPDDNEAGACLSHFAAQATLLPSYPYTSRSH